MARRLLSLLTASALTAAGFTALMPATSGSAAKTVTACVKKSTGQVKVLSKSGKKCKKGWKKVKWNQVGAPGAPGATGPKGDTGARGPQYIVKDATGATVGNLLGLYPAALTIYTILTTDGVYTYLPNGQVYPQGSPLFADAACTGTGYLPVSSAVEQSLYTGMANGTSRIAYRPTSPAFGALRAWSFTATTTSFVNTQLYDLDSAGVCAADGGLYSGDAVLLNNATAPADRPSPLTITTN